MNRIGADEWNIIVCDLQWSDIRLLWMTGDKHLQNALRRCEGLELTHRHCRDDGYAVSRKCQSPLVVEAPFVKSRRTEEPDEIEQEYAHSLKVNDIYPTFAELESGSANDYMTIEYSPSAASKSVNLLYKWVYNTFPQCISHLTAIGKATYSFLELNNFCPLSLSNRVNSPLALPPFNVWRALKSFTLVLNPSCCKIHHDVHLPPTVTKFTLIRPYSSAKTDSGDHRDNVSTDPRVVTGRIIATGMTHLVIRTCYSPRVGHDWIWPSIIEPNGEHILKLEWLVKRGYGGLDTDARRQRIFDIRKYCPILQHLAVADWTRTNELYLHLPETLTSLSISDDMLPIICTQQPNLQYLNIGVWSVQNEEWISLMEACPNVHTLMGSICEDSIDRSLNRTLLSGLKNVSSNIFWHLDMCEDEFAPPLLERGLSNDGHFLVQSFRPGYSVQTDLDEAYRVCRRLCKNTKIKFSINDILLASQVSLCAQLLSLPSVKRLVVSQRMLKDPSEPIGRYARHVDLDVARANILDLPDGCITANHITMEVSSSQDLETAIRAVATKCAHSTLETLVFLCSLTPKRPFEIPSSVQVSLPESLCTFVCNVPLKITNNLLRLLPSSLTKLELQCGYAKVFSPMARQLQCLVVCEKIWHISMVCITGECRLIDNDLINSKNSMQDIANLVFEEKNKPSESTGATRSRLSLKYKVSQIGLTPQRIGIAWRFGNCDKPVDKSVSGPD